MVFWQELELIIPTLKPELLDHLEELLGFLVAGAGVSAEVDRHFDVKPLAPGGMG